MFAVPTNFAQTTLPSYAPPGMGGMQTGNSQNPLNNRGYNATSQVPQQQQQQNPVQNAMGMYNSGKGLAKAADWASNLYDRWTMPSGVNPSSVMAGSGEYATPADSFMAQTGTAELPVGGMSATGPASASGAFAPATSANGFGFLTSAPSTMGPGMGVNFAGTGAGAGDLAGAGAGDLAGGGALASVPESAVGVVTPALAGAEGTAGGLAGSAASGVGLGSTAFGAAGADAALGVGGSAAAGLGAGTAATAAAGAGGEAAAAGAAGLGAEGGLMAGMGALGPIGLAGIAGLGLTKLFGLW